MILSAPYVLLDGETLLENGWVRIEGERIEEIGSGSPGRSSGSGLGEEESRIDLPDGVLLPGLINAHVHLELSGMKGLLPRGEGFVPWLRGMFEVRGDLSLEAMEESLRKGAGECVRTGTTTVGDISSTGLSRSVLGGSRSPRAVVFEEAVGLDRARAREVARSVVSRARDSRLAKRLGRRISGGLSPHAPYSTSPDLLERVLRWRNRTGFPLAIHASESPEEIELVRSGTGTLSELLKECGFLDPGFTGYGASPIQYLSRAGLFDSGPTLLVHVNYLDSGDLEILGRAADRIAIAFCPRSHEFFGHSPHPLPELIEHGIEVCLGTDGLSSNETLDVFEEMATVHRMFPSTPPEKILAMATVGGARGIGLSGEVGRLQPGYRADIVGRRLSPMGLRSGASVLEELVSGASAPELTVIAGELSWRARPG